jgi:hypothetical protein
MILVDELQDTVQAVEVQLKEDDERYGDTWRKLPIEGQEERIFERFNEYLADFRENGTPIPWAKVIGNAHIAMVRMRHPEHLITEADMPEGEAPV